MKNDTRHTIIMVDDDLASLTTGKNVLRLFYQVIPVPSAPQLFETLKKVTPDLILLDITMPEMNGYEAIKKLKADDRFKNIPVIFLTALGDAHNELEGFDLGAVDYVIKPFSSAVLLKRIEKELLIVRQKTELQEAYATIKDYADNLEIKVYEKTVKILDLQNAILSAVADLVECRDQLTGGHVMRTYLYVKVMTNEMIRQEIYLDEISGWNMDFFLHSVQLHDVGKIAITDLILNKPGKLTDEEFEIMKGHVSIGVEAIERIMSNTADHDLLYHALRVTGTHHEKWDGNGYPIGLQGKNIPLEGRLMAIADVYDALISDRPYKKAFPHEEACKIIEAGSGTQFDPVLIDIFREIKNKLERINDENQHI
jgi:putative two-component system response regulator